MENILFVLAMAAIGLVGINGTIWLSAVVGRRALSMSDMRAMKWGTVGLVAMVAWVVSYEVHAFLELK
jgi:hypothetical protein